MSNGGINTEIYAGGPLKIISSLEEVSGVQNSHAERKRKTLVRDKILARVRPKMKSDALELIKQMDAIENLFIAGGEIGIIYHEQQFNPKRFCRILNFVCTAKGRAIFDAIVSEICVLPNGVMSPTLYVNYSLRPAIYKWSGPNDEKTSRWLIAHQLTFTSVPAKGQGRKEWSDMLYDRLKVILEKM